MTKLSLVLSAAAIATLVVVGAWLALHYVPSPFASVTLRGDAIVGKLRPNASFGLVRESTRMGEHVSDSQTIELRDSESIKLRSARTGYRITCRTSPLPAGIHIEGEWHLHDYLQSAVKRWFIKAQ